MLRPLALLTLVAAFATTSSLHAQRVLVVGSGGYPRLEAAAADVLPGDTIRFAAGTHAGGAYVANLQGTREAWITITGEPGARIVGGTNAIQLTDPMYLRITHLAFEGQTGNGLNIDDGGSYDTPAKHLVIEHCSWGALAATGNNDQLKMSGVDSFTVRNCTFVDGAAGGSMIDMVGCHYGVFEQNVFRNAGSNCIQNKGGTQYILITRNTFERGGQRALNIGGSTGLAFFRPIDAPFEAADILVHANVFTGAVAPIAFVGAVRCAVVNNTMYMPEKWVVRILQESTDARFAPCGENIFRNNLVMLGNAATAPSFNIGSNTAPQTFLFGANLWYNVDQPAWATPNVPTPDDGAVMGRDPLLRAPALVGGDFTLRAGSPAIGRGIPFSAPYPDHRGVAYNVPPSIGAFEGNPLPTTAVLPDVPGTLTVNVHPMPARDRVQLDVRGARGSDLRITLHDAAGRLAGSWQATLPAGSGVLPLGLAEAVRTAGGMRWYILTVDDGVARCSLPLLLQP